MQYVEKTFQAMGTACRVGLYGEDETSVRPVLEEVVAEIKRLEKAYSRYRDDSVTSFLNASAGDPEGVEVDPETAALLDYAQEAYNQSDGLFDITSGVLRKAWQFDRRILPDNEDVRALVELVGWWRVEWSNPRLVLPRQGMELDFGGIVKEYAVDVAIAVSWQNGLRNGLVDLGGDLGVVGPHPDGKPWRVGVKDPWRKDRPLAMVEMAEGCLATSGDYERCINVDGQRYGHVLDPRSGWPVQSMVSTTVIAPHCVVAGTAATTALLRGRDNGREWLDRLGLSFLCIDGCGQLHGTLVE